jgi:hypothetical protein
MLIFCGLSEKRSIRYGVCCAVVVYGVVYGVMYDVM